MRLCIFVVMLFCSWLPLAAETLLQFDSPEQEQRFQALTSELRCLVCQNQSLADSHADLAGDLRREVHRMLRENKSDREIIDFLVQRYGDFVLYRPPLDGKTLALWFGPGLLLLIAIVALVRSIRQRSQQPVTELSTEQQRQISKLLSGSASDNRR